MVEGAFKCAKFNIESYFLNLIRYPHKNNNNLSR